MFVALEISRRVPTGIFQRINNIITKPKIAMRLRDLMGARYATLSVELSPRQKLDWQALDEILGGYADRVLLPEGVAPPKESRIRGPEFPLFNRQVLTHTCCALIDATRMPMYRRVLGLLDTDGIYDDMLPKLLKHYTAVKVYTHNLPLYEAVSEQVMEELGAPVIVCEGLSALRDCVLVVSPGAYYTSETPDFSCPVMAAGAFVGAGSCDLVTGMQVPVAKAVAQECPEGISPNQLCAALYEYCSLQPDSFLAETMLYNYKVASFGEVAALLSRSAGWHDVQKTEHSGKI